MRGEPTRLQGAARGEEEEEEEEESEKCRCPTEATPPQVSLMNQQRCNKLTCSTFNRNHFLCPSADRTTTRPSELSSSPSPDSFNSSFSFIQQSLSCNQITEPEPPSPEAKPATSPTERCFPNHSAPVQLLPSCARVQQVQKEESSPGGRHLLDCEPRSPDVEVDSDTASASSVTSGYESATPASEQGWDGLVKKYEGVLQECLHNNRTYAKVGTVVCRCRDQGRPETMWCPGKILYGVLWQVF